MKRLYVAMQGKDILWGDWASSSNRDYCRGDPKRDSRVRPGDAMRPFSTKVRTTSRVKSVVKTPTVAVPKVKTTTR